MATFTSQISLLNPTKFVNDENVNKVLLELQGNIEYILNFLNGNKAQMIGIWGNLWDYDQDGRRILYNGGKVDTYKKANTWKALNDLVIANDDEITWDRTNERTIYKGQSSTTSKREKWIERQVWIPEPLRDQPLIFAIKASGSSSSTAWSTSNATCETIGIQILGADGDVQVFKEVGLWNNQSYFENAGYAPEMRTAIVPFKAAPTTKSVKIKIFRTVNENYLHIDKVYIGGLTLPYDNETELYDIDPGGIPGIDINAFYDFDNGKTKVLSTSVLGHKVADSVANVRGNDLITWHFFNDTLNTVLSSGTLPTTGTGTTGTTGTSGTPSILYEGKLSLNTTDSVYTITHSDFGRTTYPQTTLGIPTSGSSLLTHAVTNVTDTSFDVVLSGVPATTGYFVNWSVGSPFDVNTALSLLDLPDDTLDECPSPQIYPDIFNYETV